MASPQPPRRYPRQRGFTLIEISVVVLIIGILATFLTLSIGNRTEDDALHRQAQRLRQLIALAAEEAALKGEQLGLQIGSDGYRFLRLDGDRRWVVYDDGGTLRPRRLPKPLTWRLEIGQRAIRPAALEAPDAGSGQMPERPAPAPQVLMLSSGEMTAFSLEFDAPRQHLAYVLTGDALGRLALRQVNR